MPPDAGQPIVSHIQSEQQDADPYYLKKLRRDFPETDFWFPKDPVKVAIVGEISKQLRVIFNSGEELIQVGDDMELEDALEDPFLRLLILKKRMLLASGQIESSSGLSMIAVEEDSENIDYQITTQRGIQIVDLSRRSLNGITSLAHLSSGDQEGVDRLAQAWHGFKDRRSMSLGDNFNTKAFDEVHRPHSIFFDFANQFVTYEHIEFALRNAGLLLPIRGLSENIESGILKEHGFRKPISETQIPGCFRIRQGWENLIEYRDYFRLGTYFSRFELDQMPTILEVGALMEHLRYLEKKYPIVPRRVGVLSHPIPLIKESPLVLT